MEFLFASTSYILIVLFFVYAAYLTFYFRGLQKLSPGLNESHPTVTVVIPARNESLHIGKCLESLSSQHYPQDKYSIIVIDDQSTDATESIVRGYMQANSDIHIFPAKDRSHNISPKINALATGIQHSSSDIVMTTDADCIVAENWIDSTVKYFEDDIGVVTGLTVYTNTGNISPLFAGIQFLDFISYTAVGAGAIGMGTINTCNGSNMAFRRKAFDDIGGFDAIKHLNTGDDSLLGQLIVGTKKWKARFNNVPGSSVITYPVHTWKEFFHQRMRWAGQATEYTTGTLLFMINTFLMFILLAIAIPISLVYGIIFPWIILILVFGVDFVVMQKFCSVMQIPSAMKYFVPTAVIHIPVILISVFGGFFSSYEWKGRSVERINS